MCVSIIDIKQREIVKILINEVSWIGLRRGEFVDMIDNSCSLDIKFDSHVWGLIYQIQTTQLRDYW